MSYPRVTDAPITWEVYEVPGWSYQMSPRWPYMALGQGDLVIGAILDAPERTRYTGWYLLEQDAVLANKPLLGIGHREGALVEFAISDSKGSDAMERRTQAVSRDTEHKKEENNVERKNVASHVGGPRPRPRGVYNRRHG